VILLSPDHFLQARRPLATSTYRYRTALGTVRPDVPPVMAISPIPRFSRTPPYSRKSMASARYCHSSRASFREPKSFRSQFRCRRRALNGIKPLCVSSPRWATNPDRPVDRFLALLAAPGRAATRPKDAERAVGQQRRSNGRPTPERSPRFQAAQYIQMRLQSSIGAIGPTSGTWRSGTWRTETGVAGWGGRTRTSEWRNQNQPISPQLSMLILKKQRNSTDSPINGLALHSE